MINLFIDIIIISIIKVYIINKVFIDIIALIIKMVLYIDITSQLC